MGEMKRAIAHEERERATTRKYATTLVISASIIAAVCLARVSLNAERDKMWAGIGESLELARQILRRVTSE